MMIVSIFIHNILFKYTGTGYVYYACAMCMLRHNNDNNNNLLSL